MIARDHRALPIGEVDEPDAVTRLTIDPVAIDALAASIAVHGQLQPGGVVPHGDRFTVVYGHRRLLACRKLDLPAYVAYVYASTTEAMLGAQLDENVIREDLNPVEEAFWFAQLLDALGVDTDGLAARLKKTRDYIERRLNLLAGDELVRDALGAGDLTVGVAEALNTIPAESARRYFLDAALRTHPTRLTVLQWIAEWRASGAFSLAPAAPVDAAAAPAPAPIEPTLPTCSFCGGTEDPWLLQFEWIHKHCLKARTHMLEVKFEDGPVRHG